VRYATQQVINYHTSDDDDDDDDDGCAMCMSSYESMQCSRQRERLHVRHALDNNYY